MGSSARDRYCGRVGALLTRTGRNAALHRGASPASSGQCVRGAARSTNAAEASKLGLLSSRKPIKSISTRLLREYSRLWTCFSPIQSAFAVLLTEEATTMGGRVIDLKCIVIRREKSRREYQPQSSPLLVASPLAAGCTAEDNYCHAISPARPNMATRKASPSFAAIRVPPDWCVN